MSKKETMKTKNAVNTEVRNVVIYGYSKKELETLISHYKEMLPDYIKLKTSNDHEYTKITLEGSGLGIELLRFNMNKYQNILSEMFKDDVLAFENKSISQILGDKLLEHELTLSAAESCTGGNIAHRITQTSGSSAYFLGSVVSYSNEIKTTILNVERTLIERFGAVSRQVVESMVEGVCRLMRTDCAIATSGIAGPNGGTPAKPVGTVWIAVKCKDIIVSECHHFKGDRNDIIESASNYGMVMLINLLRNTLVIEEESNDE